MLPNFYAVIIGSEILGGRREDKHFAFLRDELLKRGFRLKGSFIIEDDPELMVRTFTLIKDDPHSVMFSFGGIGATPDDYTRKVAAQVFGDGKLVLHEEAKRRIVEQFAEAAYPHRINMAMLPKGAKLLDNPINNVPGFYLQDRFFFVPGFPQMAHPMVLQALEMFYPESLERRVRKTLCVEASENDLMDLMQKIPNTLEFSSLPAMKDGKYYDVLSLAGNEQEVDKWMEYITKEIEKRGFRYSWGEQC
ncbi:molybdopterin-binding protein [Nitratiruptor sp. YY09-18]|uniref:competence/damage-inducible protein A n=1 Tax=Nitratiruptor sp. YY09-18 TaxID=2724901 RepID=UPI001916218C|nr:competence/damage-inducible protein A [Nitratiruptor sp. YY09-18]BCD67984.1 molybdenum cofactor biosynthesis protein MoaB [Nitratiruptor sp. YY09-18]